MNLNQSVRLSELPKVNIQRSKFDRSHKHTTTFNTGRLIPVSLSEVLPGQTTQIDTSVVIRLQTLLRPLMDNMYLDTYFFFVPNRIIWDHWEEFMGENSDSAWIPQVEHHKPTLKAPAKGFSEYSLADYFGLPINVPNIVVDALPFRAYAKIVDEFFRDENLQTPLVITTDDTSYTGVNSESSNFDDQISSIQLGGMPFIAGKYHDRFTSSLPYPQKHSDVLLPMTGVLPVYPTQYEWKPLDVADPYSTAANPFVYPLRGSLYADSAIRAYETGPQSTFSHNITGTLQDSTYVGSTSNSNSANPNKSYFYPTNLAVDLNKGVSASINDLRMSLAIQRLYERDAMYGSRYQEQILGQFGVRSADYRLDRPEFLGGDHIPLNIDSVYNVASPSLETGAPLGHVGGYSVTGKIHKDVFASHSEHGWILGLAVVRYEHSYQQGINRMWSRFDRLDYYYPVMAEISNQPIFNRELFATGGSSDDEVFGYQEAWFDYRHGDYNHVTAEMRSNSAKSLDSYHLADFYDQLPHLSADWIHEDQNNVDRVLAVDSDEACQILADFYFKEYATLPLPLYSIPTLDSNFIK